MGSASGHFAIKRHNVQTGEVELKFDVVKGQRNAEMVCERLNVLMPEKDREAGWAYIFRPTLLPLTLKPRSRRSLDPKTGRPE